MKNIQDKAEANGEIIVKGSRTGEVIKFVADISRAKELLNYKPRVLIDEGIEKTIRWYENMGSSSHG